MYVGGQTPDICCRTRCQSERDVFYRTEEVLFVTYFYSMSRGHSTGSSFGNLLTGSHFQDGERISHNEEPSAMQDVAIITQRA